MTSLRDLNWPFALQNNNSRPGVPSIFVSRKNNVFIRLHNFILHRPLKPVIKFYLPSNIFDAMVLKYKAKVRYIHVIANMILFSLINYDSTTILLKRFFLYYTALSSYIF